MGRSCEHAQYVRKESSWTASWRTVSGEPERKPRKSVPIEPKKNLNCDEDLTDRPLGSEEVAKEALQEILSLCGRSGSPAHKKIEDHMEATN